ncbi:MAG: FkbM family methyltransferase [Nitrososphaerota archaeon]
MGPLRWELPGLLRQLNISKRSYPQLILILGSYVLLRVLRRVARRRWHFGFHEFVNMRLVRNIPIEVIYYGFRIRIFLGECELNIKVFLDEYEAIEKRLLVELKPRTAIDVGAHMGSYSLFLSQLCEKVIAIEPQEAVRRVLLRNLRLNRIGNVIVLPYAASSESGKTMMIIGSGSTAKVTQGPGNAQAVRIDDVVARFFPQSGPEFVKIDVEGHELDVLKGMTTTLRERRPILLIEVWERNITQVIKMLSDLCYDYQMISGGLTPKASQAVYNILFTRHNIKA